MGIEIERRFFVKSGFHPIHFSSSKELIYQTYLMGTGDWAVRARKSISECGSEDFTITMKQSVTKLVSKEINIPTTKQGYLDFCSECAPPLIKSRYHIQHGEFLFEVDMFQGQLHQGLIIAEIELSHPDVSLILPDWIDEEITARKGYSNFALFRKMHGIKKKG